MSTETKESKEAVKQEGQAPEAEKPKEAKTPEKAAEASKAQSKEESKPKAEVSGKLAEIIAAIETLSVLELSKLVKALEEHFGVSAAVPMAVAGAPGAAAAGGGEAEEEKSSFDVVLAEVGANKIQVIKELRSVTTLGLKEAKDLVDSAPKPVKSGATKEEADAIKKKLEAVGAKVELK